MPLVLAALARACFVVAALLVSRQPSRFLFIEASRPAINRVIEKHGKLSELVENEWLHLLQLDATERAVFARRKGGWKPALP